MPAEYPRAVLGQLAARFHGHPDRELVLAGRHRHQRQDHGGALIAGDPRRRRPAGRLLGTLGYRFGDRTLPAAATPRPRPPTCSARCGGCATRGARAVAMEVSSHALARGGSTGAAFDAAVFTNLTRDHLDFHADMESYFAAKRRLFEPLKPGGRAVVNLDDPYGRRLAAELPDARRPSARAATCGPATSCSTPAASAASLVTPRGELPFVDAAARPLQPGEPAGRGGRGRGARTCRTRRSPRRSRRSSRCRAAWSRSTAASPSRCSSTTPTPTPRWTRRCARLREFAGGKVARGLRLRRRPRPRQAAADGPGRRRARRPADRSPPTTRAARTRWRSWPRSRRACKASGNSATAWCRTGARRSAGDGGAGPGWAVLVAGKGHETEQIVGDRSSRSPIATRSRARWRSALARLTAARRRARWAAGSARGDPGRSWAGAALDSRQVRGGELFFALRGERTDGHDFVADALARGAAAAVVQREVAAPAGAAGDPRSRTPSRPPRARPRVRRAGAAAAGRHHRLGGQDHHQGAAGGDARRPLPRRQDAGQSQQPLGFPLALLGIAGRHRVDGGRDGDVDPGRAAPAEPAGPARRGGLHQRAAGASGVLRQRRGDRRGQGRDPGRPAARTAWWWPTPTTPRCADRRAGIERGRRGRVVWYGIDRQTADVRAARSRRRARRASAAVSGWSAGGESGGGRACRSTALYNVENFLAAAAAPRRSGVPLDAIAAAVRGVRPAADARRRAPRRAASP